MSDLATFLLARVAEDEAAARAAIEHQGSHWFDEEGIVSSDAQPSIHAPGHFLDMYAPDGRWMLWDCEGATSLGVHPATSAHIARHDPARVLAECEAKRRIMEAVCSTRQERRPTTVPGRYDVVTVYVPMDEAGGDLVLPLLALPYADHPNYRPEWAL